MKFKLLENLKKSTAYMIRNDGELFECEEMHPYIMYSFDDPPIKELSWINHNSKQKFFEWFYTHSNQDSVREYINIILKSVNELNLCELNEIYLSKFDLNSVSTITDKTQLCEYIEMLNQLTNQEFCRMRTSAMKLGGTSGDTYFRISSNNFNWFNIIWDIVYRYRNFIETVTICTDAMAVPDGVRYYQHNNTIMNLLPTNKFLMLKGNPIIEQYDKVENKEIINEAIKKLSLGIELTEAYYDLSPRYILGFNNIARKQYFDKFFMRIEDK